MCDFSSARKGDEVSEFVTSASAISQSNLFAPRQQVFALERTNDAPDDAGASDANTLHTNTIATEIGRAHV